MSLRRFWFQFAHDARLPPGLRLGCRVTAFNLDDARRIVSERIFGGAEPPIVAVVEDVDVSTLDPDHVLPNALPPTTRGVWFPLGYST